MTKTNYSDASWGNLEPDQHAAIVLLNDAHAQLSNYESNAKGETVYSERSRLDGHVSRRQADVIQRFGISRGRAILAHYAKYWGYPMNDRQALAVMHGDSPQGTAGTLSAIQKRAKLNKLCDSEGARSPGQLVADYALESVVPGICCQSGCDFTADCEPDARTDYCEGCGCQSVASALVLADMI